MNRDLFWTIFTFVMLAAMVFFGKPPLRRFILTGLAAIVVVVGLGFSIAAVA